MRNRLAQILLVSFAIFTGYYLLFHHYAHIFNPEAILEAAQKGETERVRELIDKGVNIHIRDGWSGSALMYAAANCRTDVAALLLDRGADVNEASRLNRTPLMWAASGGCEEAVRFLLKRGADVSLTDRDGKTALMIATEGERAGVAALIRAAGEGEKR